MIADKPPLMLSIMDRARRVLRGEGTVGPESSCPGFEGSSTPVRELSQSNVEGSLGCRRFPEVLEHTTTLKPGRRLGPFELLGRLGQGGQGEVWKARRAGPGGELVALKVLKPELAHNPARMAQFRREAQRGPRLKGPSLLAASELYEIEGFHCMAMSFVECRVASRCDHVAALFSFRRGD